MEGIGSYTYQILKRLIVNHTEHEFHLLFDRRNHDATLLHHDHVHAHVIGPQARHPILWYLWFERSVARWIDKEKPDVFLSMDGHMSLSATCPTVMVCHDIAWKHDRTAVSWMVQKYYEHYVPKFLERSDTVIAVSETTKADITVLHPSLSEIPVAPNGVREIFCPQSETVVQQVRDRYTAGKAYFLFVGALHPRKNIARLIRAYDAYSSSSDSSTRLLIVGQASWKTAEMKAAYDSSPYRDRIIFTGYVDDTELVRIVGSALCLCYVSLYEGFGVPILEAMACDVPVITSDRSSMPEVAGDAAVLVNPESVPELAAAMLRMEKDAELRDRLVTLGRQRVNYYSWDRSAQIIWAEILRLQTP